MAGETSGTGPAGEELPPRVVEGARSSRSRCRTCGRKIDKGVLRIGILIEGPYGVGHVWHHLRCAARSQLPEVEAAYGERAFAEGLELPPLEELRSLHVEAQQRKAERRETPYAELAPSGRAKCKGCGETIELGAVRFALSREVRFGRQTRATVIHLHSACVAKELAAEDCLTEAEGFAAAVRANSADVPAGALDAALADTRA